MSPSPLVRRHAADWAAIAREVVRTPYPYSSGHLATGPGDTDITPERLHPAFHGSLDWHSCVHMTWSLLTLMESYAGELAEAGGLEPSRVLVQERLTAGHLATEVAYLRARPAFERPYGWAWAAQLGAFLRHSTLEGAELWWAAVEPLCDVVADHVLAWLPRQAYPVRHGKHQNDAFAFSLLLTAYRRLDRPDVVRALERRAKEWFGDDEDYPTRWEPSGTDFLSPALSEAELMSRVLGPDELGVWLERFLPGLGQDRYLRLLDVPTVHDGTDGQLVHLHGLALSRAWQLRAVGRALPPERAAVLEEAARRQVASVLPQITRGDFMATHWLVSFALLAESAP
jgi:hypothetical protein